jgi:hypothetical protein
LTSADSSASVLVSAAKDARPLKGKGDTMKTLWGALAILALGTMGLSAHAAEKAEKKGDTRVFEMRTYYAAPGKMEALHARFLYHTCKLFKKHGMEIVGFWVPADPKEAQTKLVYILAFPSREAAEKSWAAFRADPEWKDVKEASEKNGKLVDKVESVFLNPTEYSPLK